MTDQPRPRRTLPDLSKLYESVEETKVDSLLDIARSEASPAAPSARREVEKMPFRLEGATLKLDPALKDYLPPDLWRKLNSDAPRSGIYLNALERLNSLLYTISTYIPGDLVQEKLSRPIPGLVDGKMLSGCLLFSDVSGFTALSERLAGLGPQGAEHLTGFINQYFTTMIDIISWSNGTLLKFAGDATLIHFPEQANGEHVHRAARAGLRMLRAMGQFANLPTPLGPVTLSMKLGLASGPFLAASIGSPKRMEYALIGEAVWQTMQAEGSSSAGNMVVNQAAAEILKARYPLSEVKPGFHLLKPVQDADLDEFEISPAKRRARRSMAWDATLEDLHAELDSVLQQIQSLTPYLASELVDRIITHAYQRQVQSEYRPTTVMFCNFTGPEALLGQWGDSGAQRVTGLLSAYFNDMNEVITRYGGIVSRIDPYSQGTKMLVLFGAPVAHEDDPQRAVSAALSMNNALAALNRRWAQKLARHLPQGAPANLIEHRIGITLGETFAGQAGASTRREYTVMGDEVNLAARLMSAAVPGQILISEPVLERVDTYYVTRKLPPVRVKGKKKPINIWQVDGPREDTLLNRIRTSPALIGRAAEQKRTWQVFQRAQQDKSGQVLSLAGPAGIGKSHLADHLLRQALEAGWQVQAFHCRSYLADEAFACWAGLVRSLAGMTSIDHPLIQYEKLERFTGELSLPEEIFLTLVNLLGLRQAQVDAPAEAPAEKTSDDDTFSFVREKRTVRKGSGLDLFTQLDVMSNRQATEETASAPDRETARKREALQAVFAALAARGPIALFFEDSQWMDESSKDCLQFLSRQLANLPVVFLLAGRSEEKIIDVGEMILLDPFSKAETSAMVAAILTEGLTEIIHEQSNGSPLFVQEISRWIKRTHSIDEAGLRSVLQSSDILQKLVLSSLESLPEAQREVARLASVVGEEFRRSDVEALLGDSLDQVTFSAYLQSLAQARLIVLSEASVDPRYAFAQAIFRDVLYTSLPFERRRELHAQMAEHLKTLPNRRRQLRDKIAAFLEDDTPANPMQETEKLAYHYEMSEQWLAAARQLNDTAERARQGEQAVADGMYNRSLLLLDHYPPEAQNAEIGLEKARAWWGLGDSAIRQGDLAAASAAYESIAALPVEWLPAGMQAGLAARRAFVLPGQGKLPLAEKQLTAALEAADEQDAWKLAVVQAWLAWRAGGDASAQAAAARHALQGNKSSLALRARVLLDDLFGDRAGAAETYQFFQEPDGLAMAQVREGDSCLDQGDFAAAGRLYDLAYDSWQARQVHCGAALAQYRRAELAWRSRQPGHQTLSLLEEALSVLGKAPPSLQADPRNAIQKALARMKSRNESAWEPWQWQPFDDLIRIRFLMPLFQ